MNRLRKESYDITWRQRLGITLSFLLITGGSGIAYLSNPSPVSSSVTGLPQRIDLTSPYVYTEFIVPESDKPLTQKQEIMNYIIEKFGDDGGKAIAIVQTCENSSFNPRATNYNRNNTWDAGIFQVNQIHGYSLEEMYDWKKNVDAAYKIYVRAGKSFRPWTCSTRVGEANYLGQNG